MTDINDRHKLYEKIQKLKRDMVRSVLESRGSKKFPIEHNDACNYLEKEYKLNMSETRR
jgi:hypothetical protein